MIVSIIIPAYNAAKTIRETLKSALEQKSPLFSTEIIIVDDGSTDETLSILDEYKGTCRIIAQNNAGVSAARQAAFNVSRGDFIQYLDSDDLLVPGKLAVQIESLLAHKADIAYGDFEEFVEENGEIIPKRLFEGEIKGNPMIEIFKAFWRPPGALLYSRKICEKISWSPTLFNTQDHRYFLDAVLACGKLVYTPGIQLKYRAFQNHSLSQRNRTKFFKYCLVNIEEIYQVWKNDFKYEPEKKEAILETLQRTIREVSEIDQPLTQQGIDLLLKIEPSYIPKKSLGLRLMSIVVGYRNAVKLAMLKRSFKFNS